MPQVVAEEAGDPQGLHQAFPPRKGWPSLSPF